MAHLNLTERAVSKLMRGEEVDRPVVQILGFKKIAGQGGSDRFRLNISDGTHSHTFAMLATQLNSMIPDGQLDNNCIIRADKIVSNTVGERRVLIILELTVLASGSEVRTKIGAPVQFVEGAASNNAGGGSSAAANGGGGRPLRVVQEPGPAPFGDRSRPTVGTPERKFNTSMLTSDFSGHAVPIRDINPYNSSRIGIKARVVKKGDMKTWSNSRGEGKLFSMDLLDDSGEIRMTAFKDQAEQLFDIIKVGNVYVFRNFVVKSANKQFSNLQHDYEITASSDTLVNICGDSEASDIPVVSFDFVEIANIENVEANRSIDVIGICKKKGDLQRFVSRNTNKELVKRDLALFDKTLREISLTLWGKDAEDFDDDSNPVIAIKGAKVSDFGGKSISCSFASTLTINPDITEAHILRGWYDNEGMAAQSYSLTAARGPGGATAWKMFREVNTANNAAVQEKGDYYMTKVTVMAIRKENAMYRACPEATCNKKVIDTGTGLYRCEKCNKESGDFKWRAMLNVNFADASDNVWATCFQETAEIVLGQPAEVLGPLYAEESGEQFGSVIVEAVFKSYIAKFRSKVEVYNGENRLKHNVMEMTPLIYGDLARKLLNEIKEWTA